MSFLQYLEQRNKPTSLTTNNTVKLWDVNASSNDTQEAQNPNRKTYTLGDYDITRIPDDGTVIAYGKRRSGKTTISDVIFQSKRDIYPLVLTMSQTAFNEHWQRSMPYHHVHQGYEPQLIKLLMKRCQSVELFNKMHPVAEWIDPRWALNLDDVIAYEKESVQDSNLMYDTELRKTFVMGRHYNGFCNVNVQYANALLPVIKDNADIAIIFRQMSNRQKKALWLDYGDVLNEWEFEYLLRTYTGIDESTEDRDVLIVDTTSMSEEVSKNFFKYQVSKIPEEQILPLGHVNYWVKAKEKAEKDAQKLRQASQSISSSYTGMPVNSYLNTPGNPLAGNSVWEALRQGNSYR